jgi:hypothetical protein
MTRTVFLGDSHAVGYIKEDNNVTFWNDNNYAEQFSYKYNKPVVVYGMPGGVNQKYSCWLTTLLKNYDDIDELFVQVTYWNRHLLAVNYSDQPMVNSFESDYFSQKVEGTDLVDRWIDVRVDNVGKFAEINENIQLNDIVEPKSLNWKPYEDIIFPAVKDVYTHTKLWYEVMTHLHYKNFCKELFIIDRLCEQNNIKWHVWAINDRVHVPTNPYYYGDLTNLQTYNIINTRKWFLDNKGIDIDTPKYRYDGEHYTTDVHRSIATEYFADLQNAEKSTVTGQYINRQLNTESALPDTKNKSDTPL